jgi:hypothetical protein
MPAFWLHCLISRTNDSIWSIYELPGTRPQMATEKFC